jgi:thiosulfate/3-mercaptopyruvate sulfurtransferase
MHGPLVDAAWLSDHLDDVVVCDVRWYLDGRSGRAAYDAGHIPSAIFVDLDHDLSGAAGGTAGRHPLPDPAAFAESMGRLGIGDGTQVVAYDDTSGANAARLVWMLRVLGEEAALLDGPWPGPWTVEPPVHRAATFTPRPWPAQAIIDADALAAAIERGEVTALDARAGERYRGEIEPVDTRAGHIPGARNLPWASLFDPDTGRFRSSDELRERLAAAGVDADASVVAYCGSGVSACVDVLAIELVGLPAARLFVTSWSGWSADPARPVATGAEPGR